VTANIVANLALTFTGWWMAAGAMRHTLHILGVDPPAAMDWVWFELRPLVPVALGVFAVAGAVAYGTEDAGLRAVFVVLMTLAWWLVRDDDDDRWKRRRRVLAAKVAEVGGRLVVVPAGGGR